MDMRALLTHLLAAVVLLGAGLGSSADTHHTPTPTSKVVERWSGIYGRGSENTSVELKPGTYEARWSAPSGQFMADMPGLRIDSDHGSGQATLVVRRAGTFNVEIAASGGWSVIFIQRPA